MTTLVQWLVKRWVFVGVALLLVLGIIKLSNTGRLELAATGQKIDYSITNQSNLQTTRVSVSDKSITLTLPKNRYEIIATQGDTHAFKMIDTVGFYKKVQASLTPVSEKFREFVGDNPSECNFYHQAVLYSYACGFSAIITTHIPATVSLPTYITKSDTAMGIILGSAATQEGTVVFGRQPTSEAGEKYPYTANLLGDGLTVKSTGVLSALDTNTNFKFIAYREGFLAYSLALDKVYYYPSVQSQPEEINIDRPAEAAFQAIGLSVRNDIIVATYSNEQKREGTDEDEPVKTGTPTTAIMVYATATKSTRSFAVKQQAKQVELCGDNIVCVLGEKTNQPMKVYNISGNEARLEYGVSNIRSMYNSKTGLELVTDSEIIALDTSARTGTTQYTFGQDMEFCGLTGYGDSYIICVNDKKNRYYALRIDTSKDNIDSIDKKIAQMRNNRDILGISAYKNYIYISAYFGEDIYSEADRAFVPNPENRKLVSTSVYNAMESLGIDVSKYTISGLVPR
jgi:hypothetical protein